MVQISVLCNKRNDLKAFKTVQAKISKKSLKNPEKSGFYKRWLRDALLSVEWCRIMGKYVEAAQRRTRRRMPHLMASNDAGVPAGACPFTGAIHSDDAVCVLDALTADPRVSTELAVNLVMALFRTGIDSVCSASCILLLQLPLDFQQFCLPA